MNTAMDQLAISVFKKPLDECSADEIRQMTHQYPWFGPGQLLLAKKIQAGGSSLYEEQVQKTSLYFQNRLWLHHLLNDAGTQGIIANNPPLAKETPVEVNSVQEITTSWTEPVLDISNQTERIAEPEIEEPVAQEQPGTTVEPGLNEMEEIETLAVSINEEAGIETEAETAVATIEELAEQREAEPFIPINEEQPEPAETEPAMAIPQLKIEPLDPDARLVFEPYHTVDYFASLGIKFKEEQKPKDQFGQQLKSFTDWLKTMKRIPVSETPTAAEASVEKKVEQMAEHSLAERHVITEAMAEVWEKQGNNAKAEEIYRKLSLLDPLKTAYFASKIEALKKLS
ncbi:MAG: hypothetical protein WDO71_06845 [Bacteroidota bacterium]